MQEDALTVGAEEATLSVEAHIDAEAVNATVVALEGLCQLQLVGGEEGAFHQAYNGIAAFGIYDLGVGGDVLEVDGFEGQFGVQLAEVAVAVAAQIVVDAVGDVARLLYLGDDHTGTDAMYAACWDVEAVAFANADFVEVILDAAVCHLLGVVAHLNLLAEACDELAATVGIHDVPHLVLSHLAVTLSAEGVVGVNLDGEVLTGVDELDEQGEVGPELLRILLPEEVCTIAADDFRKRQTFVISVGCDRL